MAGNGSLVILDGSYGEGGGNLVRTALSMAAMTQQSVRITQVRGGTSFPGVDVEDLLLAQTLAQICSAETPGLEAGAETLTFHPTVRPKPFKGVLQGGDSGRNPNALVLQSTLAPILARAGALSTIQAFGETYGANSLTYDYFSRVALPALRAMDIYAYPELVKAGYGREVPGEVTLEIEPSAIKGIRWEDRGRLKECRCVISTSNLPGSVSERGVSHLRRLSASSGVPIEIEVNDTDSNQAGAFVTCWALYQNGAGGATAMGTRGLRMEHLVQNAFESLLRWMATDATVDPYLADQLLLPGCFAEEPTVFKTPRLTKRFLTGVWVVKQFLPIHLTVKGKEDGPGAVSIRR